MSYHLNRNGEDLGTFSLEELRRKREAGELTGNELVWRPGMANWQPVASVLASGKSRRKSKVFWITGAGLAGLAVAIGAGIGGALLTREVKEWVSGLELAPSGLASMGLARGVEFAGPVAVNAETSTVEDANRRAREFRARHYLRGYERDGKRDHACDAESALFLQGWLAYHFGGEMPETELSHWELGETIMNSDCADPLVSAIAALHVTESADHARVLAPVRERLMESEHKPYPKFWVTAVLAGETKERRRRDELDKSAVELFQQIFQPGNFEPSDQEVLAENLVHGWGSGFLKRKGEEVVSIVKNAGPEYEWLALVLEGEWHISLAWKARGSGYAHTVTEAGWRGFRENLAKARKALVPAWERRPENPLAASRMIYVAMGESDPADMRLWFERSLAAQIDYQESWARMRWGLRPRWHGSQEAMLALGIAAVDTGRFDTDVPRKFFDVLTDLESELGIQPGEYIYGRSDIWPHLRRMYEGYIAEHEGLSGEEGWRSVYTGVAYLAGKYDVARTQLEALDWKPAPHALAWWQTDFSLMPLEVAARTGSHAAEIEKAEAALKARDRAKATRIFRAISEDNPDERTGEFVRRRLSVLERL